MRKNMTLKVIGTKIVYTNTHRSSETMGIQETITVDGKKTDYEAVLIAMKDMKHKYPQLAKAGCSVSIEDIKYLENTYTVPTTYFIDLCIAYSNNARIELDFTPKGEDK